MSDSDNHMDFNHSELSNELFGNFESEKYDDQPELFSSFLATANEDLKYRGARVGAVETIGLEYTVSGGVSHGMDIGDQLKGAQNSKITVKDPFVNFPSQKPLASFPQRPFALRKTNFTLSCDCSTDSDFDITVKKVGDCLANFTTFDFSFFHSEFMWKGKYLQGSSYCEVYIHLYADSSNSVVVEANRVKGDAKPFFVFYREFKTVLLNVEDERSCEGLGFSPMLSNNTTEGQFLQGIRPIFNMSTEIFFEARLEGAKMLCDLADHDAHYIQIDECKSNVVSCLTKLINDDFECVRQHAIIAFAKFSELRSYADPMIKCSAFPAVFAMIENAPEPAYETIQVRRECSYAFANLCSIDAKAVISVLTPFGSKLEEWKTTVGNINDARMQKQAVRACDYLSRK